MSTTSGNEEQDVIVIDNGSHSIKAGLAGEESPSSVFRSIVGRSSSNKPHRVRGRAIDTFVGDEARVANPEVLSNTNSQWPISHGIVTDWTSMQQIWHDVFYNELRVDPQQHAVLLTEPALNPKANREMMLKVMFESFNTPYVYLAQQSVLSVYASGRGCAIAVECGDGVTHAVPVYEGYSLQNAILRLDFAGSDLTSLLAKLLLNDGYSFSTRSELELVRDIKETLCYVSADYRRELDTAAANRRAIEQKYTLPDKQEIIVADARFCCAEALFQPELLGYSTSPGIHTGILHTVAQCDIDIRSDMLCNIVIGGGSTLFPGFAERLQNELQQGLSKRVKVVSPDHRLYSAWIGGSILGSLSTFQSMLVSRADYDEYGPSIVDRKCF